MVDVSNLLSPCWFSRVGARLGFGYLSPEASSPRVRYCRGGRLGAIAMKPFLILSHACRSEGRRRTKPVASAFALDRPCP